MVPLKLTNKIIKIFILFALIIWILAALLGYLSLTNAGGGEYWLVNLPFGLIIMLIKFVIVPLLVVVTAIKIFFIKTKKLQLLFFTLLGAIVAGMIINNYSLHFKPYQIWFSTYTLLLIFNLTYISLSETKHHNKTTGADGV